MYQTRSMSKVPTILVEEWYKKLKRAWQLPRPSNRNEKKGGKP